MDKKNLKSLWVLAGVAFLALIFFVQQGKINYGEFMTSFYQQDLGVFKIVLWIAGGILILLAIREVFTWYWKINEMVSLLKKIENNTKPQDTFKNARSPLEETKAH